MPESQDLMMISKKKVRMDGVIFISAFTFTLKTPIAVTILSPIPRRDFHFETNKIQLHFWSGQQVVIRNWG